MLHLLERFLALLLSLVLLKSAATHISNPYYFLSSVYSYQIVGDQFGPIIASTLPSIQFVLAVSLIFAWWKRGAYLGCLGLFLVFVGVQTSALVRKLEISCGCFGAADSLMVSPLTLSLAGGCATLAVGGLILTSPRFTQEATCDNNAVASA